MKAVLEYLQQELNEGWDVREEIAEVEKAIAELEELQYRSCESCKYYQYCSIENGWTKSALPYYVCSNEHLDADGSWFRPYSKDFSCNKWEPKDEE